MNELEIKEFKDSCDKIFRAPARINLIGEHIDYNGGLVLPACVSLYITAYVKYRSDNIIKFMSKGFNGEIVTTLDRLNYSPKFKWAVYPIGIFYILKSRGYNFNHGLEIYYESDIPSGSGLSSSAAILDVSGLLVSTIYNFNLSLLDIVKLAKSVENDYCSLKSGIMDQAIIGLGKKNNALLLDCNTLKYEYKNMILNDYSFVILKTNKPRKLTESKYNERVDECNKALSIIKTKYNVNTLCEINPNELNNIKSLLNDNILFKRVNHVVLEQQRVKDFSNALAEGNIKELGKLLIESHKSLRNDYEVTGIHLDTIVEAAILSGAVGARMTGAGFGGCAIALVKNDIIPEFKEKVIKYYNNKLGIIPDIYQVDIVDGVNEVK